MMISKSLSYLFFQNGKSQTQLCKEYGVSQSALGKWIKQYSTVQIDDGEVLTAKQVKELQNAMPSSKRRTLS